MCATIEGPYQSPAFFPELLPISTSWWIPNGAEGWSPNHVTSLWWMGSASLADSGLFLWVHLGGWSFGRGFSGVLDPRGEPKDGIGTPPARAGERGRNTSKSTSVSCWASGQAQSTEHKRPALRNQDFWKPFKHLGQETTDENRPFTIFINVLPCYSNFFWLNKKKDKLKIWRI